MRCYTKAPEFREGIEENSKIIFLFSQKNPQNICCDPSLELSRRDGSNDGSQDIFYGETCLIIPVTLSYLLHCCTKTKQILSKGRNRLEQTVQTQLRLLLKKHSTPDKKG